jgi:hypothetical protein
MNSSIELDPRRLRAGGLLIAGLLVFADDTALASAGAAATLGLLIAIGFVERRLVAVGWAAILVASASLADLLWTVDWEPFNRSEDYEALPQTPFVVIALPIPMAVIALGVGAAALRRLIRSHRAL